MTETETSYLAAVRNNDEGKIREIYALFLPRIAYFIQMNGGSAEDAKDVFQDALITIYRKSDDLNFELTSKFYTFLYGICRNLWGNQLQKKSRTERPITDTYHYENVADTNFLPLENLEEENVFWEAFQQLGSDCQQLLKLFFAKVKMEEITEKLKLSSVSYAKKKKFQCKEKLVQLVKSDPRYDELKMP